VTLQTISGMMFLWNVIRRIVMERFLERHRGRITGVLSGFDRVLFRGSLRSMSYLSGMDKFLSSHSVLYKDFGRFAESLSTRIKEHSKAVAEEAGRPWIYVESPKASKEDIARRIVARDHIQRGLICVLSCVEPCQTFAIRKDGRSKHIILVPAKRKCSFLYFYFIDREFGFMHLRLQSWLPFSLQVYVNGREYLARRMDRAGIGYERQGNCFVRIDQLSRAQRMLDDLTHRKWARVLNRYARLVNPWLDPKNGLDLHGYYWSFRASEYATDVMFQDTASLKAIYPRLVDHAIRHFGSDRVLRFLGRRTNTRFNGEVVSHLGSRVEGVRVKHWVEENSIKMYDKQGSVLRIETTINNPRRFKVRRWATRQGRRTMAWIPMRKSVADTSRRVELSRAANERYLEALSVVDKPSVTHHLLDPVSRRIVRDGRPYRPLRPITREETNLFRVMLRGEFALRGFENKDLRRYLCPAADETDPVRRRKASGRMTRLLRLLRAHGLIRKVSRTRYYRVTAKGHHVMTTALCIRTAEVTRIAA
jgi:hypothetical protein